MMIMFLFVLPGSSESPVFYHENEEQSIFQPNDVTISLNWGYEDCKSDTLWNTQSMLPNGLWYVGRFDESVITDDDNHFTWVLN